MFRVTDHIQRSARAIPPDGPGARDSVVVRIGSGDSATVLRSAVLDGRAVFNVAPVSGSVSITVSGK